VAECRLSYVMATSSAAAAVKQFEHPHAGRTIVAAKRQQGNPILAFIQSTGVEFVDLVPDYLAGPDIAVLFISLRFHRLHPEYLEQRLQHIKGRYRVKVLLCRVDVEHPDELLQQVTLAAFHGELSLLLAWTDQEGAAYLETLHRCQNKGAETLMGKLTDGDHTARLSEVLTSIKGVNRTDARSLTTEFGSLAKMATASEGALQKCHGIGTKKVKQLHRVFHEPFF